jgi:16S rRNA (cytidine1402-2'-O)-methyltransferase
MQSDGTGRLFIVSTPIGNLGDFPPRAVEVLGAADLILAEDTRHSRTLLERYGITTRMSPYHEHNEAASTPGLVRRLQQGQQLALISDAGTPLLSDPGQRLVRAALDAGVPVMAVPGPSALLAALVVSGLDASRFAFHGFLPRRGKDRSAVLDEVASSRVTSVLYEAPGRVASTLLELAERSPEREAVVARELTKQYEETRRGTVASLAAYYKDVPPRGEVVLVVAGAESAPVNEAELARRAAELRGQGLTVRDVAARLAADGAPRNVAYRIARDAQPGGANKGGE